MKKAIHIASVASMIDQFNRDNISILQDIGYRVDVAANFVNSGSISEDRAHSLRNEFDENDIHVFDICIPRSIFKISKLVKAYNQLKIISKTNKYEIVHCHSPIGGALTRLAFRKQRKKGTTVIYTAHGFHFYKGASLINWLVYYPIEWLCSFYTDELITINTEDFEFAKKHMRAKKISYIPGVGVETNKFASLINCKNEKKKELDIPTDASVILSVGELNTNKNHVVIIKALSKLLEYNIHYCVVGKGILADELINQANSLGVGNKIHLIGYRNDIVELNQMADIFAFPSKREGLGLAAIEGMATGLPLICSNNRGSRDYAIHNDNAFVCDADDSNQFAKYIKLLLDNEQIAKNMGARNKLIARKYDKKIVNNIMREIYGEIQNRNK